MNKRITTFFTFILLFVGEIPTIDREGLYIYWYDMKLFINFLKGPACTGCGLQLTLTSEIKVINNTFFLNQIENVLSTGLISTTLEMSTTETGQAELKPFFIVVPISFQIDTSFPVYNIYIGNTLINPDSNSFVLQLQDRHGMVRLRREAAMGNLSINMRNGTFMAAPPVAGTAALFHESHPNASPAEVKQAILDLATRAWAILRNCILNKKIFHTFTE